MRRYLRHACMVLLGVLLAACQTTESEIEQAVKGYGFTFNIPPSTLYAPGTLVARLRYDPRDSDPKAVTLDFLCSPNFSVKLYKNPAQSSDTYWQATTRNFGGTLTGAVPVLQKVVDLNARLKAARSISATISDTRVHAYAPDDLASIRSGLGPECRNIVNKNIATQNAYQVSQVLEATVEITVELDTGADANAQVKFTTTLAQLGFAANYQNKNTLKGNALYYGIRLQPLTERL